MGYGFRVWIMNQRSGNGNGYEQE